MYKCNKCGNEVEFEEINVIKTYINQNEVSVLSNNDEFFYRENVICLECESTLKDGNITEEYE